MARTILITGASSGIGKATARYFHDRGYNVVATMRTPEAQTDLVAGERMMLCRLDVTDSESIQEAVASAIDGFGRIDVLLNNAGYGAAGPVEAFPMENIRRQFETNVIGLIEVTKAVLPHMRKAGSGVIVNISSIGGRMTFPLFSLYHGTKFAVEGLSESLHYELEPLGIRIKIVEPGVIATDFGSRSLDVQFPDGGMSDYQPLVDVMTAAMGNVTGSPPEVVSEVIWEAVCDESSRLRYPAGEDAVSSMAARSEQDDATFIAGVRQRFGL